MSNKTCTKCARSKSLDDFPKGKHFSSGYNPVCKICINAAAKKWRSENREKYLARSRRNYHKHRIANLARGRKYYSTHVKAKSEYDALYRTQNADKIAAYKKAWEGRKRHDPVFKIKRNLRRRVHHALNGNYKADTTFNLIGCSPNEFKRHLESLFLPGMSWENYGTHGWHIDHIIPCYEFDLSKESEQRECFHYTNQRPLWAKDNLTRSRRRTRNDLKSE